MTAPARPLVRCIGCGEVCRSAIAVCRDCRPALDPTRPRRKCPVCGVLHRAQRRAECGDCADNPAIQQRIAERKAPGGLTGGRWVAQGGVQRYVLWTDEDRAARMAQALAIVAEQRRQRVKELLIERYGENDWWQRHGEVVRPIVVKYDDEVTCARRREALEEAWRDEPKENAS